MMARRNIPLTIVVSLDGSGCLSPKRLMLLLAPWLAANTINAPHLAGVLRIGALLLFINAINGAQTGALSGFEAFRTIAYVNLFVGLTSFPILIAGAEPVEFPIPLAYNDPTGDYQLTATELFSRQSVVATVNVK